MSDTIKPAVQTLPVLPLRNLVLFPGVVLPVDVGRAGSLKLVDDVVRRQPSRVMIATQKDPQVEDPTPEDLHSIGVEAEILKVVKLSDTRVTVVIRGLERRRLGVFSQVSPYLMADVHPVEETSAVSPEADGLALAVRDTCKKVIALSPDIPDETGQILDAIREPSRLADIASANLEQSTDERMALLAELDVPARLKKVLGSLQHRVQVFEVKEKIDTQVREEFSRHQREAVLRQKLKAIQEELGEFDDGEDVSEFDEKIKAAGMSEESEKVARKQLERLKGMPAASAEYTVTRTYLEWLVELPWSKKTDDRLDLAAAREILDADHYDLQKVKKRILEYLAVRKLAPQKKGPILCLAGPPGVGKTSLGKSIARALGREFVRISLGGVRDEAEIRGHRRTYIGALPGRIIQGMKRAGTQEPGLHARRDRQARRRFPRRPVGGAARGARPRAEQHLQRSLPRGDVRSVGGHLHRHGERPVADSAAAARPHGDPRAARLHAAGEARHRHQVPGAEAALRARPDHRPRAARRPGARRDHRALHA